MEPLFFGTPDSGQFGIYHAPEGMPKDEGVVICPPLFAEYLRSHACLRRLALALASDGFHVLRFDYRGTGDSWGDFETTTAADWQYDIRSAVAELQAVSGVARIRLIGVRLGATLAARAALDLPAVKGVVMWDPVLDGRQYLTQLESTHKRLLDAHVDSDGMGGADDTKTRELVGFCVSADLVESVAELVLPSWEELAESGVTALKLVLGVSDPAYEQLVRNAEAGDVPVEQLDFDCNWATHSEAVLFPHDIVSALSARN